MAKINDLKRVIAFDSCRFICDKNLHSLVHFDARCFSSLTIKFGQENRKGLGSVQVKIQLYMLSKMYIYTLDGWFDHVLLDANFKCITIESDFSPAHLYSINNNVFNGLWLEEEEGDAAAVPVTASVAEASDFEVKRISTVK